MKRLILLLTIVIPIYSFSQIIFIPEDYSSITAGLNAAKAGDTIVVNEGTYYENLMIPGEPLVIGSRFLLTGDTSFISKTIIDGSHNGTVVTFPKNNGKTVFTGFTITNGGGSTVTGGGIVTGVDRPELSYLIIKSNSARRGGGIAVGGDEGLYLDHCMIIDNTAILKGGGIYLLNSEAEIRDCRFINNIAEEYAGGAIHHEINSSVENEKRTVISGSYFYNNSCSNGSTGGLYFTQDGDQGGSTIKINGCTFEANKSKGSTALSVSGPHADINLENCMFRDNEAEQYSAGASLIGNCKGRFVNCLFYNNHASTVSENGNSGGATVWGGAQVDFINCAFVENTAAYGAGLSVGAGGLSTAINSIFWGNSVDQIALIDYETKGGELSIDYCDVENGIGSISVSENSLLDPGMENMAVDPKLLLDGTYPCQLDILSPCIDAGTPDINGLNLPYNDLMGNIRVYDGDSIATAIIDLGPYEYGSLVAVPEYNSVDLKIQVYPNPFTNLVTLSYNLKHPGSVHFSVYNRIGQLIYGRSEYQQHGSQQLQWDAKSQPEGLYFFTLTVGGQVATGKLLKAK